MNFLVTAGVVVGNGVVVDFHDTATIIFPLVPVQAELVSFYRPFPGISITAVRAVDYPILVEVEGYLAVSDVVGLEGFACKKFVK